MVSSYHSGGSLISFEQGLVEEAVALTLDTLEMHASAHNHSVRRLGGDCVSIEDEEIIVRSGVDPLKPRTLVVSIARMSAPIGASTRVSSRVAGNGWFSRVKVSSPAGCVDPEVVADAVRVRLEARYREETQNALQEMASCERKMSAPAYQILRRAFPAGVAEKIWLYQVEGNEGRYLLDTEARLNLMAKLAVGPSSTRARSALALYRSFAGRVLPLEGTYSEVALRTRCAIVGSLVTAPYAEGCFELAEQVVMEGQDMYGQPLIADGHIRLLAGYPPALKDQVEAGLAKVEPDFAAICSAGLLSRLKGGGVAKQVARANEVLELKPNAFGVGINLNALIARYVKRP
jgi:hypothetical protein